MSRKLLTIVDTPTFAAIASSSAMSASDRPGNCWRVSAQNQLETTPWLRLAANPSTARRTIGKPKAAPINNAPSNTKPVTTPLAVNASTNAMHSSPADTAACTFTPRPAMTASARGCAPASNGMRDSFHSAVLAATPVPPTAIAMPIAHQIGRNCNVPVTSAP